MNFPINERLIAVAFVVGSFLVSIFLFNRKYNFRASVLMAYFVSTTVDLLLNVLGISTVWARLVVYRKLSSGGIVILYKIPLIASVLILIKVTLFLLGSLCYEVFKESLPDFIREPLIKMGIEEYETAQRGEKGA